jgi:O-antigen ligase
MLRPRSGHRQTARARRWALPGLLALVLGGFALVIGIDPVLERFFHIPQDLEQGRLPAWQAALAMWRDAPLLGHGWGSYESLWPAYADHPTGLYFQHAHNEYLQLLAEAGLAGAAVIAYLLFLFVCRTVRTLSRSLSHAQRSVIVALAIGITSIVFHSATDFGLRIPAVAFMFTLLVALFVRVTDHPSLVDGLAPAPEQQQAAG